MSWFKVDDKLWGHPKWLATPIRARGLWVTAGSWCADQEQDGMVPRHVLPMLGATVRDASALVAVGLWIAVDSGWCFHGWADFQPTREQKESERQAARERMRAARERKAAARSGSVRPNIGEVRGEFGGSSEDVRSTPTRPDPTRTTKKTSSSLSDSSSDVPDLFDEFWKHYPRKDAKQDAAKAWRQVTKDADPSVIVAGVQSFPFDSRRTYQPLPASWLRGKRWEDEQATLPLTTGARLTSDELTNLLGPDMWTCPTPPAGMGGDEVWEWRRQQQLAHIEDRQQQARARLGRTA